LKSPVTGCNNRATLIESDFGLCQTPYMAALRDFITTPWCQGSDPATESGIKVVQIRPSTH